MTDGTVYEVFVDGVTDSDFLQIVADRLNEIAADNIPNNYGAGYRQETPDDPKPCRGFYVAHSRITLTDGDWGVARDIKDDVNVLSKEYSTETFKVIFTRALDTVAGIEELGNYWRGDFKDGELVDAFHALPIVWESDNKSEDSWFI